MADIGRGQGDGGGKARRRIDWGLILAWFLRTLALAWLVKGLVSWTVILGVEHFGFPPFEAQRMSFQAATIFFAILDLVAAVGLWLLAAWGGVVWLIAVATRLALSVGYPQAAPLALSGAGALLTLVVLFAGLHLLVARQKQE